MPTKKRNTRKRRTTKNAQMTKMQGEGIMDILGGINDFLKKNKIISTAADVADTFGVPHANKVGQVARIAGYGKPKRKNVKGKGLSVAGSGLKLAGSRKCGCKKNIKGKGLKTAGSGRKPKRKPKKKDTKSK